MSSDRRIFERLDAAVTGELLWQLKRRSGTVKTNRIDVTTVDLSVDGARVSTSKRTRLPVGASVRLTFAGESTPARVRGVLPDPHNARRKLLLLQFDQPPAGFLQLVDQWLDAGRGGNRFKSEYWRQLEEPAAS